MIRTRHQFFTACLILIASTTFAQTEKGDTAQKPAGAGNTLVTFIELGSVKCIPCRKMQPVMASIEKKYDKQVKVVFYDVWKEDQSHYAEKYGVRVIPTQVFLDSKGKEFFRHEGYFPEGEIDKLLRKHGVSVRTGA
jgi:thioredoxin 1